MPPATLRARPLPADARIVPSPAAGLARFGLDVDPGAGTVTWTPDRAKGEPRTYPLGLGTAGAAVGLRRVRYRSMFPIGFASASYAGRLLLVDADGAVLEKTRALPRQVFDEVFPPSELPVAGFTVADEQLATTYRLNRAHRGAAPFWPLTSNYLSFLVCALLFAVLVVAIALGIDVLV